MIATVVENGGKLPTIVLHDSERAREIGLLRVFVGNMRGDEPDPMELAREVCAVINERTEAISVGEESIRTSEFLISQREVMVAALREIAGVTQFVSDDASAIARKAIDRVNELRDKFAEQEGEA